MRASVHAAAGAAAGLACGFALGPPCGVGVFLSSALLDADHVAHFSGRGMRPTASNLFRAFFMTPSRLQRYFRISRGIPESWAFPALHSVELAGALALLGQLLGSGILLGLSGGTLLHLLMDTRYYPGGWRSFSLLYKRIRRRDHRRRWMEFHPRESVRER